MNSIFLRKEHTMKLVTPKVIFAARTEIDHEEIQKYLDDIGADEYHSNATSGIEELIEIGGKICYKSFQPELNPNVKKVRTDNKKYLQDSILKSAHGSVLEHGNVTFLFYNVSRVFTHELVRHRAGTAMSQESLRYVRLTDLGFWMPKIFVSMDKDNQGQKLVLETIEHLEQVQRKLAEIYDIDNITDFVLKKKLTSAFRRVAPIGLSTAIMYTMNIRAARHIIQMRTDESAEEEIRLVYDEVGKIMQAKYPNLFADFVRTEVDGYGCWTTNHPANPYDRGKA